MKMAQCIVCGIEFQKAHCAERMCSEPCRVQRVRFHKRNRRPETLREQRRRYNKAHREQRREAARRYRAKETSREKHRIKMHMWREANLKRAREIDRRSYYANYEKVKERWLERYRTNRDQMRAYFRERYRTNPETSQKHRAKYRAALKTFRELIGPCDYKHRHIAYRLLQHLGAAEP